MNLLSVEPMRDPRTPEILAWLDAMPLRKRIETMHGMAFALPRLKNDREWMDRINKAVAELDPDPDEMTDIIVEAGRISGRLRRELG